MKQFLEQKSGIRRNGMKRMEQGYEIGGSFKIEINILLIGNYIYHTEVT